MQDKYRAKFISVILQPKVDPKFWLFFPSDNLIHNKLLEASFPLFTEIQNSIVNLEVETINGKNKIRVSDFAFGTETSEKTRIPHYQIYLEFKYLVRLSKIYNKLDELLKNRVHIATKKVYNSDYKDYCTKLTSNFQFNSSYYWNIKLDSITNERLLNNNSLKLIDMRPKLKEIKNNYLTGQQLLLDIALSEPDDRTGIWLADIIGGTGKTAFFQTIIDDIELKGLYLRVSEGVERLSAKLRRKIRTRLEKDKSYPKFIWVNFGRTVEEGSLKAFADFAEQILDGMLDDNFGNTGSDDFVGLPYVNLIVTANTPPNLKHLTGDRIKLLTLFPIYKNIETFELEDSILIPIYVEIKVRLLKCFPNNPEYKFKLHLQNDKFVRENFKKFPWFEKLLANVEIFKKFQTSDIYKLDFYQKRLESEWISAPPYNLQSDILAVYYKALAYSTTVNGDEKFIEASSLEKDNFKVYSVKDYLNI